MSKQLDSAKAELAKPAVKKPAVKKPAVKNPALAKPALRSWDSLNEQILNCKRCPRLVSHCENVAQTKRRAYLDETYWGKPVPNFGSKRFKLLVVGLAPGAHGANRTGRMFSGDRSGDWLYRALFRAGFANQAESKSAKDGLKLRQCSITNVCHCAPPQNKVTPEEVANCVGFLDSLIAIGRPQVIVALGNLAWDQLTRLARNHEWINGPKPKFEHGGKVPFAIFPENRATKSNARLITLLGSYHPSQQNTFTGRLTEQMFDDVFDKARKLCDISN